MMGGGENEMSRLLLLFTILLVLSLFPCHVPNHAHSAQQATEIQQQSDHANRVNREKQERELEKQVAAVGATRTETRGLDNFVVIMLVVSAGALLFISRRISGRRRGRRRPRGLPLR
jgi:hypothetical protein